MSKSNAQTKPETTEAPKTATKPEVRVIPKAINSLPTKSAKIRALSAEGWEKGQIAKAMGIIYQHVYNVLAQPLPKAKVPKAETKKTETKVTNKDTGKSKGSKK